MLRVAFIGAGQMATHHLSALRQSRVQTTVVGVHDPASDRAQAFAALADCRIFPTVGALFGQNAPDIVHVCTPPSTHFECASAALERGAHVYVEKPFAMRMTDARALLSLARDRGLLVCAGHQLLYDPAFSALCDRIPELGTLVQVDSDFAFRPVGASPWRSDAATLARHLIDILPHPLYSLVSVLARCFAAPETIAPAWLEAEPADLQSVLKAGDVIGRLSVSLRARPVASTLTVTGTRGSLTCDFARSIVVGTGNSGTEALEKVLNPVVEGTGLARRSVISTIKRITSGNSYAGLPQLIEAFYSAVENGSPSPVSPEHLLQVTRLFETMVDAIEHSVTRRSTLHTPTDGPASVSRIAVTGARGFLGAEVARALSPVRGIGRGPAPGSPHLASWVSCDLSQPIDPKAFEGVDVVVHTAAEVAGGYPEHQRNSIDATRHLLNAMHEAGVKRLVHVSSLSVIRPPRWAELQSEATPRPEDPRRYGPYTWGKCAQEAIVEREAAGLGIATRIIRPGALIDPYEPEMPGMAGRRLFGRWHLGLGRSGLPIAVCEVGACAQVVAWCAKHFDDAPPVVNLFDPTVRVRADLIAHLRRMGWRGHVVWVPISALAAGITVARKVIGFLSGHAAERLDAWSVLRPRWFDGRLSAVLFEAVRQDAMLLRAIATPAPAPVPAAIPAPDRRLRAPVATAEMRAGDTP